jgi:hypothetical protein
MSGTKNRRCLPSKMDDLIICLRFSYPAREKKEVSRAG